MTFYFINKERNCIGSSITQTILPFAQFLELQMEAKNLAAKWDNNLVDKMIETGNYSLILTVIKNPKYPFKPVYLNWCSLLDPTQFDKILDDLEENQELLRELLSVECLESSTEHRFLYHRRISSTAIQLFESTALEPFKAYEMFDFYVKKVLEEMKRKRLVLHSFCSAPRLCKSHFRISGIWRLLGVKCLSALLNSSQRDKIDILNSFFDVFRLRINDSSKHLFLKLIILLALKHRVTRSLFKIKVLFLLRGYRTVLSFENASADRWIYLSKQILVSLKVSMFSDFKRSPSFASIVRSIHRLLADDPEADAQWLLSFAYVLKRYQVCKLDSSSIELLIGWFFSKNPSADEVCQLYEIFNDSALKPLYREHLLKDQELLEMTLERCYEIVDSSELPLKMRVDWFLRRNRGLDSRTEIYSANHSFSKRFPNLNSFLMHEWHAIQTDYAIFFYTVSNDQFISGPDVVKFWFNGLLSAEIYHHVLYSEDKPVIVPSLLMPYRLAFMFGGLLVRSIIYNLPWPFYLPKAYFEEDAFESFHQRLTNPLDESIMDAFDVPFDCEFAQLEVELRGPYKFYELDEPISQDTLKEYSSTQKNHFIDGIMEGFDFEFSLAEIVKIFGNKLM